MPFNLYKKYPELLEIGHYSEKDRNNSLKSVFLRDIENNSTLNFRAKKIYPIKGEEPSMQILYRHLTTVEIEEEDEQGKKFKRRIFELDRSVRLHWIKYHLEELKKTKIEVFSVEERDTDKRKDIIRTYIYDIEQKYVIVLEPQRTSTSYYLLSAHYLNKEYGTKKMDKKLKKRLPEIY